MEIYLQTSLPNEFFEINQYLNLNGIYFDTEQAVAVKADLNAVLAEFLKFMREDQKLIVPAVSGGFRNQLDEIRQLYTLDQRILFVLPPLPDGLMCSKACKTLKIPTFLGEIVSSDQLLLAENIGSDAIVSLGVKDFHSEGKDLLKTAAGLSPSRWMITGIDSQKMLNKVVAKGLDRLILDYKSLNQMMYNPVSQLRQQELKEEWLIHFASPVFTRARDLQSSQAVDD